MNNYNDLADIRGTSIPMFNQHGTALSQEEREAIAKKKGVCVKCGLKTHDVGMFKRVALTNDHVYGGKCIRCNSNSIPAPILQAWEQKFKPSSRINNFKLIQNAIKLKPQKAPHEVPNSNRDPSAQRIQSQGVGVPESPGGHLNPQTSRHRQALSPESPGSSLSIPDSSPRQPQSELPSDRSSVQPPVQSNPVVAVGSESMLNEDFAAQSVSLESGQLLERLHANKRQPDVLRRLLHRLRNTGDEQGQSLHEIKEFMEIYSNDAKFLTICCGALWGVVARSDSLKARAAETGAINTMLDALSTQSNQRDPDFVQWVFGSISCLAQCTISKQVLVDSGSIELILVSMQSFQTSAAVFEWSCRALYSMVVCFDENGNDRDVSTTFNNICLICEDGGVSAIVSMMKLHSSEIVSQMWAIKLLWRLQYRGVSTAASKKVSEKILVEGGISVCSKILKNRSTNPVLCEATAALLYRLLSISNNDQINSADCMVATIRKLNDNPGNIDLSVVCCDLLVFLVTNDRLEFKDSEGLKAVLVAMSASISNAPLQRSAATILWAVSYIPAFFDLSLLKESLETLVLAKEAHPSDVQFLSSACGFIANVVTFSAVTKSDIPFHIPIHALKLRNNDSVLQDQAGRALGNICSLCPKLMKKVIDSDGIKLLIQGFNSTSTKVIQSVTSALISIARQSDDLKRTIIDAGCIIACKTWIQAENSATIHVSLFELINLLTESRRFFSEDIPDDIFLAVIQATKADLGNPQLQNLIILTSLSWSTR
jgi:pantothenate kinase